MRKYFLLLFIGISLFSCNYFTRSPKLFTLKDKDTGITFENNLTYTEGLNPYTYRNFYNGGGVALGDINNDGLIDVFFTGNLVDNKLYLNKGNWKFEDITESAGVACKDNWSTGATFVDINADGLLDLYVCKSGKPGGKNRNNELFINKGDNTFSEKSALYGLDIVGLSVHAAFFDFDKDGDLDCYVLNNSIRSVGNYDLIKDQRKIASPDGNKFLRNDNGKFVDISNEAGIYSSSIGFGLGITLGDYNNDSWTDIFISNDFFERDYMYINNTSGGFTETLVDDFGSISMGSMGADAADLDNDLLPDIMVTEMLPTTIERKRTKALFESWDKYSLAVKKGYHHQFPRNALQRNLGEEGFVEISRFSGVDATEWSWASLIFDMDNDGLKDILISNGIYKDLLDRDYLSYMANDEKIRNMIKTDDEVIMKLIDLMPSKAVSNAVFKNKGDFHFENTAKKWGLDQPSFSNGSAYGDLDNDGDLDIVINNVNMPAFVYENKSELRDNHSIRFNFLAEGKNTLAIGTKVIIKYGNGQKAMAENYPSRGFMSSVASGIHFGLGAVKSIDSVFIYWPNGITTLKTQLVADSLYTFNQPNSSNFTTSQVNKLKNNVLKKITPLFDFKHTENPFSDFNREPLLPQMFSNEGPIISMADINDDGILDYFIGGSKNQSGSLFLSNSNGEFTEIQHPFLQAIKSEDTAAVFFDSDSDGDLDLYVCSGGKAFSKFDFNLQDRLYINNGLGEFSKSVNPLPFPYPVSSSSVSSYDFDQDGDLDLLIGERFNPQVYGIPSSAYLLENIGNNTFSLSTQKDLQNIGMTTSVQWCDINNDGIKDAVISGDWMPISIFINIDGKLINKTSDYNLKDSVGIWSSVVVDDIDNDGDLDIIAGNVGENSFYQINDRLYLDDFDKNGSPEQIFTHKRDNYYYPIVDRDELVSQMPILKKQLLFYKDYATSHMESIFNTEQLQNAIVHDLNTIKTTLFLNTNETYTPIEFPSEIQYSNTSSILVYDIDSDGVKDIITGGNQYKFKPQFGISDASHGWFIKGEIINNTYSFGDIKSLNIHGQIRDFKIVPFRDKSILITTINNDYIQFNEIQ